MVEQRRVEVDELAEEIAKQRKVLADKNAARAKELLSDYRAEA